MQELQESQQQPLLVPIAPLFPEQMMIIATIITIHIQLSEPDEQLFPNSPIKKTPPIYIKTGTGLIYNM